MRTVIAAALAGLAILAPAIVDGPRAQERRDDARADVAVIGDADVAVYGATPAGVTAAVAAARAGRRVLLLEAGRFVGGMVSGGLSNTDTGPRGPEVISGLTAEFFRRVRAVEASRSACLDDCGSTFFFEPHVAERVFEDMLRDAGVQLQRSVQLRGVDKNGATITRLDNRGWSHRRRSLHRRQLRRRSDGAGAHPLPPR